MRNFYSLLIPLLVCAVSHGQVASQSHRESSVYPIGVPIGKVLNPIEKEKMGLPPLDTGQPELSPLRSAGDVDYSQGVIVVNEDWFGHSLSSFNFLDAEGDWHYRVNETENPGHLLGVTSQYGTIYGDKFYVMSKQGVRLVVFDAKTMKVEKEFTDIGGDGRAFLGVDEHTAFVGTSNGITLYDIDKQELKGKIQGTESDDSGNLYKGQTGTMIRVGDRVFVVHQKQGILVIDVKTNKIETTILGPKSNEGIGSIVLSKDGTLWASAASVSGDGTAYPYFWKIDPYTLEYEQIPIPEDEGINRIPNSWYAWTADGFCASAKENKLYWNGQKGNNSWFTGSAIFCYDIDKKKFSLVFDISTLKDAEWKFYGAAFRIHPVTDEMYCFIYKAFTTPTHEVIRINTKGEVLKRYPLKSYYWFPALPVFPDNKKPVISSGFPSKITLDKKSKRFSLFLGDMVSDADNSDAAIIKSIISMDRPDLLDVRVSADSLIVEPVIWDVASTQDSKVTVKFNSNGHVLTREIVVALSNLEIPFVINDNNIPVAYTGKTVSLYASAPAYQKVTWSSENPEIAEVNAETGLVTAKTEGTVRITAKNENTGAVTFCELKVLPFIKATKIVLKQDIRLVPGEKYQLIPALEPENASPVDFVYSTSNSNYIKVDEKGMLTAIKETAPDPYFPDNTHPTVTVKIPDNQAVNATVPVKVAIKPGRIFFTDSIFGTEGSNFTFTVINKLNSSTTNYQLSSTPVIAKLQDVITWEMLEKEGVTSFDASQRSVTFDTKKESGYAVIKVNTLNEANEWISDTCKVVRSKWAKSLTLDDKILYLPLEKTFQLQPKINWGSVPENSKKIVYRSDKPDIVFIDENGLIKPVKDGSATITAFIPDGSKCKASMAVIINGVPLERIELSVDTIRGEIDSVAYITVKRYPENATEQGIRWFTGNGNFKTEINTSFENVKVAKLTKISNDTIKVFFWQHVSTSSFLGLRAASEWTELSDTARIYTNPLALRSIYMTKREFTYDLIEDATPKNSGWITSYVKYDPDNSSEKGIRFATLDSTIFYFSLDQVGGVKPVQTGSAKGYVYSFVHPEYVDSCWIHITNKSLGVKEVSLDKQSVSIEEGKTDQLFATVTVDPDKEGVDTGVEWVCDDPEVATVSDDGVITALKPGSTLVRAFSKTGHIMATCEVWVVQRLIGVTGVELDRKEVRLELGNSLKLTATVSPSDASNPDIVWKSSEEEIVAVDKKGYITGLAIGHAVITVTTDDGGFTASCEVTVADPEMDKPVVEPTDTTATLTFPKVPEATYYEVSVYKYVGENPVLFGVYTVDPEGTVITGLKSNLRSGSPEKIAISLRELDCSSTYIVKIIAIKEENGQKETLATFFSESFTTNGTVGNETIAMNESPIFYKNGTLYLNKLEGYLCYIISPNGSVLEVLEIHSPNESHSLRYAQGVYFIEVVKDRNRISQKIVIK